MKKFTSIVLFVLFSFSAFHANAKIRRVGYFGTALAGQDYSSLQQAHDSSAVGDSLYIFPGSWTGTFTKRLVVIGYGYFVTGTGSNANLQNITGALTIGITLQAGSDNSVFQGLDGFSLTVYNNVAGVKINRCNFTGSGIYLYPSNWTATDWQVTQCYNVYINASTYGGKFSNLLVSNSFITYVQLKNDNAQTGLFNNNVFLTGNNINFGNGSFAIQNCIFIDYNINSNANCVYNNCISNTNYFSLPVGNGNQSLTNAQATALFVGHPTQGAYSNDGRFALIPGCLAIGAGVGGVDCGMYGGISSYKLSGVPPVPSFYKLTAPSTNTSTNPYTITFSVKSNN